MMKLCIDCKYYALKESGYMFVKDEYVCTRLIPINVVTGIKSLKGAFSCEAEREDALRLEHFRCGFEAKYFQPKDEA